MPKPSIWQRPRKIPHTVSSKEVLNLAVKAVRWVTGQTSTLSSLQHARLLMPGIDSGTWLVTTSQFQLPNHAERRCHWFSHSVHDASVSIIQFYEEQLFPKCTYNIFKMCTFMLSVRYNFPVVQHEGSVCVNIALYEVLWSVSHVCNYLCWNGPARFVWEVVHPQNAEVSNWICSSGRLSWFGWNYPFQLGRILTHWHRDISVAIIAKVGQGGVGKSVLIVDRQTTYLS